MDRIIATDRTRYSGATVLNINRDKFVLHIFEKYGWELRWFVSSLLRSRDDVDDLVQDTYLKITSLENPERIKNPKAYVFSMAYNLVIDNYRRNRVRAVDDHIQVEECELPSGHTTAEDLVAARQKLRLLCEAIQNLPETRRRIFVLRKFYDMDYREISDDLGISQQAVRKHVSRALRDCLLYVEEKSGKLSGAEYSVYPHLTERKL